MPTGATSMTTLAPRAPSLPLKMPTAKAPSSSGIQALRAMYQRAARAFLKRNTAEAQDLIDAAFRIVSPPATPQPDQMAPQRKKWDILRITLETTLYTSPNLTAASTRPRSPVPTRTPSPVPTQNSRSNLLLSPPSLLATLHTRSLRLFTPPSLKPSPAFLPPQILLSLVIASLKLECPQVGRGMVEEWLARRSPPELTPLTSLVDDGYAKVIDVYCLHILPRLGEWDYASEFLRYEVELPADRRSQISESLTRLYAQSQAPSTPPPPYRSKALPDSRRSSVSAESLNGRHSRASSTSSYTAIPPTPKPGDVLQTKASIGRSNLSASVTSITSKEGARAPSRASTVKPVEPVQKQSEPTNLSHAMNGVPSSSATPLSPSPVPAPPTLMGQLKLHVNTLSIHYLPILRAKLPFILCVLLPLLGLIAELRRRSKAAQVGNKGQSAKELRQRLQGRSGIWFQALRAVRDTVIMAGRGLV